MKQSKQVNISWKKKDTIGILLIIILGLSLTTFSFLYKAIFDIVFSICLGLLIGGFLMSFISFFLAQMESNILGEGELDIDANVDIDVDADVDIDVDADVDIDVDADVDMEVEVDIDSDLEVESDIDTDIVSDITPAPIMLLISTSLLFLGISGILLYYFFAEEYRFLIFFLSPLFAYITTKIINLIWKKMAKSRYYEISSTRNLIGIEGEVVLPVDNRGGIIKISSNTPMKFEKIPVKPLNPYSIFERGEKVIICTTRNGKLFVDNDIKSIKKIVGKSKKEF